MTSRMRRLAAAFFLGWSLALAAIAQTVPGAAAEAGWPRTVTAPGHVKLIVYQPQLDRWSGVELAGRLAVQVEIGADRPETRYGILGFEARALTDKGSRTVTIDSLRFPRVEFPSSSAAEARAWSDAIAHDLTVRSRTVALDRLEAAMAIVEAQAPAEHEPLRNEPPRIVFSSVPAILVYVDGEPRYGAMQGTPFERLINTRPLVLRDRSGTHYLKVFDGWMSAPALDGPWRVLNAPSGELAQAFRQASDAHAIDPLTGQSTADRPAPTLAGHAPAIVVARTPTELIVTDGAPRLVPMEGAQLLYVENTTGNIFKDPQDNRTYVLIAGRWFRAGSDAGPWAYVAADALPAAFARIPDDSPKENVKASIAGTAQAREAAIAASLPQTAAIKVAGTTLTPPRFDGAPVFKPIAGTPLAYAANTPTPIIRVDQDAFYAVEHGVWFVAGAVRGPWTVAQSVPAVIYSIPPSSPLHYVTYVHVYATAPGTVYVGYSPGYTGSVVDPVSGVVVYGTGYAYDPWIGSVWYGAPVTYGYGAAVAYTPWTGWAVAFGLGWAWGAATVAAGWGWGPYPYWGPWGGAAFGPRGGAVAWGPGGWAGYSGNVYRQWGARASVTRAAGGYDAWTGNTWAGQVGASYNSRTGIASAGQRGAVGNVYTGNYATGARGVAYDRNTGQLTSYGRVTGEGGGTVARVGNDVYAGKDGHVYRNTGGGWQQYSPQGGWSAEANRQLDGERNVRELGAQRTANLQRSSLSVNHAFGPGAPSGFHGGGGFRRR